MKLPPSIALLSALALGAGAVAVQSASAEGTASKEIETSKPLSVAPSTAAFGAALLFMGCCSPATQETL